uniref:Uncharacterized protein n=1 Tax=Geospiza parvula TaxID=87175 RepID=A0A8C3Q855_GEOPR
SRDCDTGWEHPLLLLAVPAPLPPAQKPGECPKVRPQPASEPCTEMDSCSHDRDCSRQEKCCFSGCAMRCTRPHPGQCPRAGPCWELRRGRQCLDDNSQCPRGQRCTSIGCGHVCMDIPGGENQPGPPGDVCGCPGVPRGEVAQARCAPAG